EGRSHCSRRADREPDRNGSRDGARPLHPGRALAADDAEHALGPRPAPERGIRHPGGDGSCRGRVRRRARGLGRSTAALAAAAIASTSCRCLIGEVPGVAGAGLGGAELIQLRRDLLAGAGAGSRLVRATSAMLRVMLSGSLLEEEVAGTLPSSAAEARAALAAGLDANLESAALRAMAAASDRIGRLVALAPRLRTLPTRAGTVAAG